MRILLLLLLPLTTLGQSIDSWDVVRNGYYKVVVDGDTLEDNFTRYDTALKFAYDYAENSAQGLPIEIVSPNYRFEYSYVDVDTTSETVYDTANVEDLALRQVNMSYQNISGQRSLSYQAEAHGDSVLFEYFHNGQLLQKSLQYPKGGIVRDTLKDPPLDSIQVWVHGYWDKWVEPYHEIVDIAFLDTLGQDPMSTFFHNFDDDTLNQLPSGFTELFGSSGTWEVVEYTTAGPDQYLNNTGGGTNRDAVGWEQGTDIEIVTRYYRDTGAGEDIGGPAVRMDTGGAETGYTVWARTGSGSNIVRHESGSETTIQSSDVSEAHRWLIARLRINGSDIKLRYHPEQSFVSSARSANDDIVLDTEHYLLSDMAVQLEADTMPGGLSAGTTYYVRRIDDNQIALQESSPVDGGASDIDITSDGSSITILLQDDETQRSDWNFEITDSNISGSGYAGFFDIFGRSYFDWIGVGTNGDTAPSSATSGATALSGSIDSSFTLSGNAVEDATLSGDIINDASISGNIIQQAALSGNIPVESNLSGNLIQQAVLSGELQAASDLAGSVVKQMALSGQIDSESSLSGQLIKQALLSGSIDAQSALSGNIIIVDEGVTSLSGSISTESSLSGNLTATKQIQGIIESETDLSGSVIKQASLSGDLLTVSSLSADASIQKALAGTLLVSSSISGELSPVGAAWGGTIDITNSPLYSISFEVKPMHEISIQDDPLYTINIKVKDE